MRFYTVILVVMASVLLSACGAHQAGNAPPEVVSQARYVHSGPPALTLFTMVNNRTGAGGHSSLMINGSQRVIFDPAGSVRHETVPERNDVLYGITPGVADFYTRAHARATHHVVVQRIVVSPEVAERALQLAISNGSVGQAQCALSVSAILRQLPGFQGVKSTWFPVKLSESFGQVPGVVTERFYEYDDEDKSVALRAYDPQKVAAQNQ
ncbi:hypothetical protein [Primorskyibacter flagellatus]|uniref:Lipoprotein n=1 Tax=Primorskyibacter flagellatus TaxID=1387277 RepID=A0A1W2AZ45_9RHOB|nr:hypothetical protein [Primorskyibacter flagellatus]SMC65468.1 hypothetical protein SAMN06295998_103368 [Primorskyibacter flagellatus]